ncbi:hypothetical protein HOLleu_18644 [Holothuria leucospilota]|uniref:Uncharacterized protein n=1 Tax=Holothuria leucospilota TaxID=206669 RepID=A0A9Q1C344_HOLLE|nr:hypothetical protein HOLleu_18644 [Holothuria leucospilota]
MNGKLVTVKCSCITYTTIQLLPLISAGKPSSLYDFTNQDWVSSQNLGHNKVNIKGVDRDASRYKRLQARDSRKTETDAVDALLSLAMDCPSPSNNVGEEFSKYVLSDNTRRYTD